MLVDTDPTKMAYLQHAIWKVFGEGKLHFAPLNPNIQRILDVGTGTGSWAMDIADEFPSAEIVGTDLSPIQPPFVPPNVTFLVDDLNVDWLFSTKFDYIHSRMLCTAIRDWKRYCQQAYDNLKPGGWIELQEVEHPFYAHTDNTAPPTNALINWSQKMYEAALQVGIDLSYPSHLEPALTSAGFTNITHEVHIGPWGTWHPDFGLKKLGYLLAKDLEQGLSGLCMGLFTRNLGWTMGEVEAYLVSVRGAIWDEGEHVVLKGLVSLA
ncbi:MAG: hypothetical protein M1834_002447 [Cirrosporium novae-zelandiae]|nr:MAG: hypothetical protein M1834_002447 [Cirrosporium novae-zelandiae]